MTGVQNVLIAHFIVCSALHLKAQPRRDANLFTFSATL
jgi:hypothetical protein